MKKLILLIGLSTLLFSSDLLNGKEHFDKKQYKEAYKLFMKSAHDGMVAKFNIGYMYEAGLGVEKNIQTAIYFYKLSASDGYDVAQNNLGNAYLKGIGVEKNLKTAIYYYNLASKQKNKEAIKSLNIIQLALKKKEDDDKKNKATLTIRSNVSNDKVYVNNKYMGKTKLVLPIESNKNYSIEVRKDGYTTYKFKTINLKPKEKKTIKAILRKL